MSTEPINTGAVTFGAVCLAVIDRMEHLEIPWKDAALKAGLSAVRPEPDDFLPFEAVLRFCEECALACGDDAFGLNAGYYASIGQGDFADYVTITAATVEEGIKNWARFQRLATNAWTLEFENARAFLRCRYIISDHFGPRAQYVDLALGYGVSRLRLMTQDPNLTYRAEFSHPAPNNMAQFRKLLGEDIAFGCEFDQQFIPSSCLTLRPPNHEPHLKKIIEDAALRALSKLEDQHDGVHKISSQISESLKSGDASLETVSRELAMSKRTLQRVLESEGTSYRKLTEDVRKSLAERYLVEEDLQISQVAYLLGYSEISAFSRAVKIWFGVPPKTLRTQKGKA